MRGRPLTLAMLVAVVGHGLWLAHAELRQRRQPLPQALRSRDDSPELLVFSRLPPEPLTPDPIPLPTEEAPPPPPPPLPAQGSPIAKPAVRSAASTAAASSRVKKPAAVTPADAKPAAARPRPPQPPQAQRQREEASLPPLRRLEEARRKGPVRLQGEMLQSWRSLWQAAEDGTFPPAALDERSEENELRRIPLTKARAEGLEPSHGEVLRLDDHLLLAWIDGGLLWLLRAPA